MNMRTILIIGTSTGIGKACVEYFQDKGHTVISVSRSQGATFVGNVCDEEFRNHVVNNSSPDVVINCAGMTDGSLTETLTLNHVAPADLTMKFYEKLAAGSDIINISSMAATVSLAGAISKNYMVYANSKDAISTLSVALSKNKSRDVRVSVIEPDIVMPTNFNSITKRKIEPERYTEYQFENFTPIKPEYIPEIIEWMINQPRWVNISRMTINNNCKATYANTNP